MIVAGAIQQGADCPVPLAEEHICPGGCGLVTPAGLRLPGKRRAIVVVHRRLPRDLDYPDVCLCAPPCLQAVQHALGVGGGLRASAIRYGKYQDREEGP